MRSKDNTKLIGWYPALRYFGVSIVKFSEWDDAGCCEPRITCTYALVYAHSDIWHLYSIILLFITVIENNIYFIANYDYVCRYFKH